MITIWITALALLGSTPPQIIPTHYEAGRFFATPQTSAGDSLRLLVDTGGGGGAGMYWLSAEAIRRLGLATGTCSVRGNSLTVAKPPAFAHGEGLPPSAGACPGKLMVNAGAYSEDGQLGAAYLGTRRWTFDYPQRRLVAEGSDWQPPADAHAIRLGLPANGHFPRIVIHVDGQPLNMLLDTGATAQPTVVGRQATGRDTVNGEGAASYITHTTLERWHAAHPDWTVVTNGDNAMAPRCMARLIRVPRLAVGGWSIGPVWFTERPDAEFHAVLDELMDEPPEGAIGGNVLDRFTLSIDYPRRTAWLGCDHRCVASTERARWGRAARSRSAAHP